MVALKIIGIILLFLGGAVFGFFLGLILFFPGYPVAPSNYLNADQIHVYSDRIVINITNASWGGYANTGSMIPTLNENSNGIRIVPESENDIHIGDLITYVRNESCGENCTTEEYIIHRVIEIGSDEEGIYWILKGDANPISDGKVRFSEIRYKTIIVLY